MDTSRKRDEIFDLERREGAGHAVEARLVPTEDLQRLIGAREHARDRDERALVPAVVHRHDTHLLRHREHRHFDLARHALGGAVAGSGLGGRDVGIGNEVDVGAGDPRAVGGQDDRAVHLGELGESLRRELRVEQETARADVEHLGRVADDDERAHLRLQDSVDTLTQRRARRDQTQRAVEGFRSGLGHGPLRVDLLERGYPVFSSRSLPRPRRRCLPRGARRRDRRLGGAGSRRRREWTRGRSLG